MRKLFLAFLAVCFVSCTEKQSPVGDNGNGQDQELELPSDGLVEKTFIVSNLKTKTSFDGSVTDTGHAVINWCADDSIAVWDGTAIRVFNMISEPQAEQTVFKGRVAEDADEFYAVYPCAEELQILQDENGGVSFSVSTEPQRYIFSEPELEDGSVYAVGKVGADDRLEFNIMPAILKFSLKSSQKIKSVKVEGNSEDDFLCGTMNVSCDADGVASASIADDSQGSASVTLRCLDATTLPVGKDIYMLMPAHCFESGYTVTFTDVEDKVVLQGTEETVVWEPGKVYEIQNDYAPPASEDYYQDYVDGLDVMIAGKAYNKATYGNATLIAKGQTATISTNGVYFIEDGAVVDYNPGSSLSKMIIVGRDPSVRSPMIQKMHFKMATNGVLAVMNLAIDSQLGGNYLFNIYSSNAPKSYAVDNCSMKFTNKNFLYHAKATWVSEVQFHNCDIEFTYSSGSDIWLFNVDSATPSVDLFDFQNNVFWHSGTMASGKAFRITNGEGLAIGKLIFKNNTFINLPTRDTRTSYIGSTVSSGEVSGNLIYLPTQPVNASMLHGSSTGVTYGTNYYYTGTDVVFNPFTAAEGNPFTTCDVTTGTFVKASAYKDYGAKR